MCEPTTWVAIGSAVIGGIMQNQQASAQNKAAAAAQNARMAGAREQSRQTNQQAEQQKSLIAREIDQQQASLQTIAGEFGVDGNLKDRLSYEIGARGNEDMTNLDTNLSNNQAQMFREGQASNLSVRNGYSEGNNWIGTGLQIAGSVAGGYEQYRKDYGKNATFNDYVRMRKPSGAPTTIGSK